MVRWLSWPLLVNYYPNLRNTSAATIFSVMYTKFALGQKMGHKVSNKEHGNKPVNDSVYKWPDGKSVAIWVV